MARPWMPQTAQNGRKQTSTSTATSVAAAIRWRWPRRHKCHKNRRRFDPKDCVAAASQSGIPLRMGNGPAQFWIPTNLMNSCGKSEAADNKRRRPSNQRHGGRKLKKTCSAYWHWTATWLQVRCRARPLVRVSGAVQMHWSVIWVPHSLAFGCLTNATASWSCGQAQACIRT